MCVSARFACVKDRPSQTASSFQLIVVTCIEAIALYLLQIGDTVSPVPRLVLRNAVRCQAETSVVSVERLNDEWPFHEDGEVAAVHVVEPIGSLLIAELDRVDVADEARLLVDGLATPPAGSTVADLQQWTSRLVLTVDSPPDAEPMTDAELSLGVGSGLRLRVYLTPDKPGT